MLDPAIGARFRDGDPDAVRAVYREYGGLVYAVAFKALGDRELAEEAAQETFVRAWRGAQSFDADRELAPWLATIARRVAIDVHRRESRRTHERVEDVAPAEPALVTLPPAVEQMYELSELRQALAELPDDERRLVELQHFRGFTQNEIAAQLGIPLGTVKSRIHRAHRRLALRLGHLQNTDEEPTPTPGT